MAAYPFAVRSCRAGWLLVLTFLLACVDNKGCDSTISSSVLEDCANLSSEPSWTIRSRGPVDFGSPRDEINLTVGQSHKVSLWPLVASECVDIFTVEWRVANSQVASVLADGPRRGSAWLTGMSPGTTRVSARLRFSDGVETETQPTGVRVSRPEGPPAGSILIVEGETELEPSPGDGVTPADFRRFVPFTTPFAGRIHIVVDWISPLNKISYVLTEGRCNSPGGCGTFIFSSNDDWIKPLAKSTDQGQGRYTVRIDNVGPGHETIRYEVRLTPR